jgi:hypothetical protein
VGRSTLSGWVAVGCILVTCASAAAQTQATCSNIDRLGATHLQVSEQLALATVDVLQPGGAGRRVEVDYGDEAYIGVVGRDGKAQISFALTAATNEFDIQLSETPPIRCKLAVPEFKKVYRAVLRWRDPIQLDLHVIEPEGRLGGVGDVGPNQPRGLGQMDLIGRVPVDGGTSETSYVVVDGSTLAPDRIFEFRVEYVTRGMKPVLPYCDDGALASAQMELIIIDRGVATSTNVGTNRLHCGVAVPENRRFMVLEH